MAVGQVSQAEHVLKAECSVEHLSNKCLSGPRGLTFVQAWPDLPAASAIAGLQGGASPAFSQVPSTLLVVSPALSLLGKSSAFRALWSHEGCGAGRFEPSELQLSAIAWAGFYSSLQAPEASELPLLALEPVLGRLQDAEELRLMAVTGSTLQLSDGKIVAWGTSDPSAEWEAAATELARKLWHSLSVKRCHGALQQTLSGLREKLLDEKTGQKEADAVLDVLVKLQGAFESWETTALKNHGPIGALTAQIDARLLIHPEALMTSMLNSFEMLQWLRKMPDDSDYLVRIEVALNRSEMEVPMELWLAAEGRVDESKLSALTAVRTTLHDLIYRAKSGFSTLDALLESLSSLEHSTELSGLVEALDFAFSLLGPLSELLGGKDAALARMLQMLKPTSCARWLLCYPRLAAPSPADDKAQEEEEETLAQTPAEARMLYLMLSSPGWLVVKLTWEVSFDANGGLCGCGWIGICLAFTSASFLEHEPVAKLILGVMWCGFLGIMAMSALLLVRAPTVVNLKPGLEFVWARMDFDTLSAASATPEFYVMRLEAGAKPQREQKANLSWTKPWAQKTCLCCLDDFKQEDKVALCVFVAEMVGAAPPVQSKSHPPPSFFYTFPGRMNRGLLAAKLVLDWPAALSSPGKVDCPPFQLPLLGRGSPKLQFLQRAARCAGSVLDDLRVAGHPDYQEIHVEWPLSLGLSDMKSQLHALRERQANWRQNLIKAQQTFPVLGFFAARQLGCLLNAVSHDLREHAEEVLAAVASTWLWQSQAEAWSSDLLKRCRLQTGAEDKGTWLDQSRAIAMM
ncbi:unnamed protein product, partial [Symbiodinium sp. CCMP2456]